MAYPFAYTPRLQPGRHKIALNEITEFSQPFETTYVDEAGRIAIAPPNTPRFENGELLIERASYNAFASPDSLTAPHWAITGDTLANDPAVVSPDGLNGALRVNAPDMTMAQAIALQIGTNYAPSVWAYYPEGADALVTIGDAVMAVSQTVRASSQWVRLSFDAFTKIGSVAEVSIHCPTRDMPLWLWWPQLEPGFSALSGPDADVAASGGSWDFIGPNITRVGFTLSPEGTNDAVVYQSSAMGNSFIGRRVQLEPLTSYRFTVWTRLVSGVAPKHRCALVVDSSNDLNPAFVNNIKPIVTAKPPAPEWAEQVMTFSTTESIRDSFAYFAVDWETDAHVAYWRPVLTRQSGVTPTSVIRDKRANDVAYLAEFVARYTPDMRPLRESHEADALESELKAMFIDLLDEFVRPAERMTNTVGIPHIGAFAQMERAVSSEGLALQRRGDQNAMRYVFRSWRARNPKRGLHMLRTYLQLLWPNGWEMHQQWSKNGVPYTSELSETDEGDHFLTSRVMVFVHTATTDGADVASVAPSLRSVVPARIVLSVQVLTQNQIEAGLLVAGVGSVFQTVIGTFL